MNFKGKIFWRGDEGYEQARIGRIFNHRRPGRYPQAVFFPKNESDVQAAVLFAKNQGWKIAIRAGGHSWAAWSLRDEGILLDLKHLNKISYDEKTGIASAGPAMKGGAELNPFLKKKGRFFNGGHCPTVGIGGFLLQGGQGWNTRGWGWSCQYIEAIDVVTADGQLLRASETENADLFWAARGAGPGFFGVVTCFHLKTKPRPKCLTASTFIYPAAVGEGVLKWLLDTHGTVDPDMEIIASGQVFDFGPGVVVHALSFAETPEAGRAALLPFENCPFIEQVVLRKTAMPTTLENELETQIKINPEGHCWAVNNLWLEGSPEQIAALSAQTFFNLPSAKTFTLWFSMKPLLPLPDMAFSMQTEMYMAIYTVWEDEQDDERCKNWLADQMRQLEPVTAGQYLGDSDLRTLPRKFMADENFKKLQEIRAKRDPQGIFHNYFCQSEESLNQNIFEKKGNAPTLSTNLKPHHVGISVANLDESIEWYGQVLGFELMWSRDFPHIGTKIAFLSNGNMELELFEAHDSKPLPENRRLPLTDLRTQGTKHLAFEVQDIENLFQKFHSERVDVVLDPTESPPKDGLFGFVRDPSGVLIEFLEKYRAINHSVADRPVSTQSADRS